MQIEIDQEVPAYSGYAAARARGLYNVSAEDGQRFRLRVEIPEPSDEWHVGVVVGPSGSGKSSVGRELVARTGFQEFKSGQWPKDEPVIEVLTAMQGSDFNKATAALAAVGLGSVPSWLRPRRVLSTGEGFRADMAKLSLSTAKKVVVDEFTSVLDRQVAQVGAGAFARAWRKRERWAVLLTCHYDILDWVQPDWVIDTAEGLNQFAEEREVLQPADLGEVAEQHEFGGEVIEHVEC